MSDPKNHLKESKKIVIRVQIDNLMDGLFFYIVDQDTYIYRCRFKLKKMFRNEKNKLSVSWK